MKKLFFLSLLFSALATSVGAQNPQNNKLQKVEFKQVTKQVAKSSAASGEVISMNKQLFIDQVFDFTQPAQEWKYKGSKPAIIDLYADWCGPCRMVAPILKDLAKEYAGQIVIYKVNVDKEKELAALFQANSIPLFVFIPMDEAPQLMRGAADKATYKKAIDEFLLKKKK